MLVYDLFKLVYTEKDQEDALGILLRYSYTMIIASLNIIIFYLLQLVHESKTIW